MLGSGQSLKCGLSRLAGAQLPAGRASGQRVAMLAGYRQPGLQSKIAIRENSSFLHFSRRHGVQQTPGAKFLIARGFADYPSHIKVALPALSPTMEMGTIVSWEKKVGDQVSEGDLLCEIETDKATMGFETPEEGYLAKVMIEAGSKDIPVGRLLCIIVENAEDVAKFADFVDGGEQPAAPKAAAPTPSAAPAAAVAPPTPAPVSVQSPAAPLSRPPSGDRPFASPAAKKAAAERGIDLFQIKSGSGMDGMITSRDVEHFKAPAAASTAATGMSSFPASFPISDSSYADVDTSNIRKVIAKRLQQSKHEIPHYYLTVECSMDSIMKLRKEINAVYEKEGVKLSVNDFIIKATALASKRVPQCNSAWMDTFIREYHSCDVSVAVDTGTGLITPIVHSAESKGLAEISATVRELATKAKEGKLQPNEFQGGTITVSNLGMFGINQFTAIINPPQACILAVGGTEKRVVASAQGEPAVANVMRVTLSCDHRVVDGAVGAQWLQHFKRYLENPQSMLL